jgi:hypothetical protein
MLQVWFLSWQTEVNPRKPIPATPYSLVKQIIPDSSARMRERRWQVVAVIVRRCSSPLFTR